MHSNESRDPDTGNASGQAAAGGEGSGGGSHGALWKPIVTAPKDGRVLWTRGWDWGKPNTKHHHELAFWHEGEWKSAVGNPDGDRSTFLYLVEWMELPR
jgi:hypothetical protein